MMKTYIKIFVATLLLLGACKTQKPVIQDGVTHAPTETIQPKVDTVNYQYRPTRYYSIPKKILKDLENYETAFNELKAMLEGRIEPNFERAVFISENPYHGNKFTYEEFQRNIDFHIYFIQTLIAINDKSDSIDFNVKVNQYGRFNIDDIRHLPKEKKELYQKALANWAIFKYITDSTTINTLKHFPLTYASHDPFGKNDWANSQVINLLVSEEQKGNCFALTAFYKILADRLNADARLCTAPQHIYIQHRDKKGDYYNVELATAGHPGDGTIQTLTHTTPEAINSGIALRSFDERQSIGLCLVNLAKSYEHKFGSKDDDFMLKCAELVLKHNRLNLNALLLKQQILDAMVTSYSVENNINDINQLKSNSEISQTVYELEKHLSLLYRLGYRQMPYDMQEIIMTGIIPEDFEDKNPSPFTTIVPKEEHKRKFTTLYGGLFQEVFEIREFEPYGHFTFQTSTNKITAIDTTAQAGFLIDPVAFAYDFGARMYDARLGIFTSIDPHARRYPTWSPYSAFANNPLVFVDPDGRDVIPTNQLKANTSLNTFFTLASENSVFREVMKSFYANHNHVWVHVDQLKRADGTPTGFTNTAVAQSNYYSGNPVGKYGQHRIVINSDVLTSSGEIGVDQTFLFRALVHEGDHARMFERYKQSGGTFEGYPGHQDFLIDRGGTEGHHNQMGAFNRGVLVDAMKEFDEQIRKSGGVVPDYHTEDWYEAMSWYGLTRTQAWEDFKKADPDKAANYTRLINEQIDRHRENLKTEE